jgi:hypothetical protein
MHALVAGGVSDAEADVEAGNAGFLNRGLFEPGGFIVSDLNSILPHPAASTIGSWASSGDRLGELNTGSLQAEWLELGEADDGVGLFVMGSFDADVESELGNAAGVQWGMMTANGVSATGVQRAELSGYFTDWRLVLLDRPPGTDHVRLLLRDDSASSGDAWVASSMPLGLSRMSVESIIADGDPEILINAALSLYFPCVGPPATEMAVAESPGIIIQTWGRLWQTTFVGAASSDRYFGIDVRIDPPLQSDKIGAHTGNLQEFVFVSQEYLTGQSARVNGSFTSESR